MSMDMINDEDNFLELLGDEEEENAQGLFQMDLPNFNADPSTESDSGKTDDDSSVSVHNEVSESTTSGRWNAKEHDLFLKGLMKHGKGWKKIAEMIQTRNVVQVRTHAQKYFQKLERSKQQQMNSENGNGSGSVIGPVSVSIAENSSLPSIDSVMQASSSVDTGEHSKTKTTSKRKRKWSKGAVQDNNESCKLKISIKRGRKAKEEKSPMIVFNRVSQDETDEETKSETSNSDIAPSLSSTATLLQPDIYDNHYSSQSQAPLKIKLEKTKKEGTTTGTPSPTSISEELSNTQVPVIDDWLHVGNAALNFHSDLMCNPDANCNKFNMNIKQNKCVTGYAIPLGIESVVTTGGFYEPTFDDSIITQDILDIFEV